MKYTRLATSRDINVEYVAKWGKEVSRDTAQEKHGETNDADAERGNERGSCNLGRALEDPFILVRAVFKVPFDVFNGHGRVVDKNADCQSQTAQGHDVDRLVNKTQYDHGA